MDQQQPDLIASLRARIASSERGAFAARRVIPFGIPALDVHLRGGLARGALHEIAGGGLGALHAPAAALFLAGVLARIEGPVLWCFRALDLFAPALAGVGLHPDRIVYAEAGSEKTVLACLEEGLRHAGLAGVVGEVSRLSMTASRRLQLATEASGVTAFVIRRWRTAQEASAFSHPTAAFTRWRITAAPSSPLPVPGVGRARWRVELVRCRGGEPAEWEVEACDAQGRLAVPAELADRSAAPADGQRGASA